MGEEARGVEKDSLPHGQRWRALQDEEADGVGNERQASRIMLSATLNDNFMSPAHERGEEAADTSAAVRFLEGV